MCSSTLRETGTDAPNLMSVSSPTRTAVSHAIVPQTLGHHIHTQAQMLTHPYRPVTQSQAHSLVHNHSPFTRRQTYIEWKYGFLKRICVTQDKVPKHPKHYSITSSKDCQLWPNASRTQARTFLMAATKCSSADNKAARVISPAHLSIKPATGTRCMSTAEPSAQTDSIELHNIQIPFILVIKKKKKKRGKRIVKTTRTHNTSDTMPVIHAPCTIFLQSRTGTAPIPQMPVPLSGSPGGGSVTLRLKNVPPRPDGLPESHKEAKRIKLFHQNCSSRRRIHIRTAAKVCDTCSPSRAPNQKKKKKTCYSDIFVSNRYVAVSMSTSTSHLERVITTGIK